MSRTTNEHLNTRIFLLASRYRYGELIISNYSSCKYINTTKQIIHNVQLKLKDLQSFQHKIAIYHQ